MRLRTPPRTGRALGVNEGTRRSHNGPRPRVLRFPFLHVGPTRRLHGTPRPVLLLAALTAGPAASGGADSSSRRFHQATIMTDAPGRNDPCPCGSGRKYKHCCRGQSAWYENKTVMGVGIGILLLVGALLFGMMISNQLGTDRPDCPDGQVWSDAHGHCH